MKKSLLIILIVLLLALTIYIALEGFEIGEIEVLSYENIKNRSNSLDEKIQEASKKVEKDFKSAVSTVEESTKKLAKAKEDYEEEALVSSESDIQTITQIEEYKVETLWVKLGTYATTEGVVLQMDIKNSSTGGEGRYDLNFEVNGSYISITDFISDIENDSMLGFKIESFRINEDTSSSDLVARFVCKNIAIQDVHATTNSSAQTNNTNTNNTNTNSTNTNSTNTNSTNTTNTSSES